MTVADTANSIAGWALVVAIAAALIALVAAGFTGWQALTAHRARMADNDRALVEWEPATWPEPDVVEIRSKGPDNAWGVWARLTVNGQPIEHEASRIRPGQALRFQVPALADLWELHRRLAAREGEEWNDVSAFEWGAVITWRSRYGRPDVARPVGMMRRRVRYNREPDPFDGPMPGAPI